MTTPLTPEQVASVVDRDALVEWFHEREHKHRWPCTYDADVCANLRVARYQADAILASGVVQDAADVRRAVAEEAYNEGWNAGWMAEDGEHHNPYQGTDGSTR